MLQNINLDYLDLLPKKLDDQQKKALAAQGNVIVAAGAGSGKTQVLATRFAYLVMSFGIPAEKILTLTFTKKAASEMYQRIYKTLDFFSINPDIPELERKRAQKAIADFAKVHIQTLDSYNSSILKQCASRYGISPDFTQGDGTDKNQALRYVMEHRNDPVIHDLVTERNSGNLQAIANDIQNEIMKRSTLASDPDNFVKLCSVKKEGCNKIWRENYDRAFKCIDAFSSAYEEIEKPSPAMVKCETDFHSFEEILNGISANLENMTIEDLKSFEEKVRAIPFGLPGGKGNNEIKEVIRSVRLQDNESVLSNMFQAADYVINFQSHYNYALLLDDYMGVVNNEKRLSGFLSFADISEMALKALKEQPDLRTQEQNAFDRIMIDEFQDNNQKNRDLLFLLSAKPGLSWEESLKGENLTENKLFFVGDDKQSIYKFRGADVSVFKQLGEDLGTDPVDMVYNYRSTEYLLDSFNYIFGGFDSTETKVQTIPGAIFPEKVDSGEKYAAVYSERQIAKRNMSVMPESKKEFEHSPVHFCIYNKDLPEHFDKIRNIVKPYQLELQKLGKACDFESARDLAFMSNEDQQCYFIAKEISERIKKSDGKLTYSDFAVLDKSRGMRKTLVKYLSYFDIPYNLDSQIDIFESAPVNDIYNFLRLCVYPSDKKALAVFLCSPFAGLSVQDVEEIYALGFGLGTSCDKDEIYKDIEQTISGDSYRRFIKVIELFQEVKKTACGTLLAETITDLWYKYGYRYETLWHKDLFLNGEHYDLLFELARKCDADGMSLSYFIDQLDALRSQFSQDSEIDISNINYPKEITDAIQVMTIHKSKGLQFPYVFVLGITGTSRGDYEEKDEEVTSESPFGESNSMETKKAEAEFRRLIYVALTRAEKEVYVVGNPKYINGVMMSVCKAHYPEMEKNAVYSIGEYIWKEGAPFDYLSIFPVDRNTISDGKKNAVPLTIKEKNKFLRKNKDIFKEVNIITLESQKEPNPLVNPSKLEKGRDETGEELKSENPVAPELLQLMPKLSEKNFHADHFGTFAHAFMESFVKDPENVLHELPAAVFRNLWDYNKTEEENFSEPLCSQIINVCKKMCEAFEKSKFAKELKESAAKYFEYPFIAFQNGCVVNGIMDLCYLRSDGKVIIVDYKTNEHIHPEKYYSQLACYKDAASELFGVDKTQIECHLFYLRYGQAVDITKEADESLLPELLN